MYKLLTVTIATELYDIINMLRFEFNGMRVCYKPAFTSTLGWVFPESPILYGIYVDEENLQKCAELLDKHGWTAFIFKQTGETQKKRREVREKNRPLWQEKIRGMPKDTELDKAIKHCYEVADDETTSEDGCKCRDEHLQLAAWLEDYRRLLNEKIMLEESE